MLIYVPGFAVSFITFPGVMLHEMAHKIACDFFDIPVFEAVYYELKVSFEPGESVAGYVIYQRTNNIMAESFIAIAPFILNSIVCAFLLLPLSIKLLLGTSDIIDHPPMVNVFEAFLLWVGISCGFNAIPSNTDVSRLVPMALEQQKPRSTVASFRFLSWLIWFLNLPGISFFAPLAYIFILQSQLARLFLYIVG